MKLKPRRRRFGGYTKMKNQPNKLSKRFKINRIIRFDRNIIQLIKMDRMVGSNMKINSKINRATTRRSGNVESDEISIQTDRKMAKIDLGRNF